MDRCIQSGGLPFGKQLTMPVLHTDLQLRQAVAGLALNLCSGRITGPREIFGMSGAQGFIDRHQGLVGTEAVLQAEREPSLYGDIDELMKKV